MRLVTDKLSHYTGLVMIISSVALMVQWPVFAALQKNIPYPGEDMTMYLVMTAGALLMVWGWLLWLAGREEALREHLILPTALAFAVLAAMRFYAFGASVQMYQLVGATTLIEALLFTVLMSLYLVRTSHRQLLSLGPVPSLFADRLLQIWHSFRQLPGWVQCWLALILLPVNMAAFFFTDSRLGFWVSIAMISVLVANATVLIAQARFSRVMSVPHLLPWGGLQIYLAVGLVSQAWSGWVFAYALLVFATNAVSLVFDVIDSLKWQKKEFGFV